MKRERSVREPRSAELEEALAGLARRYRLAASTSDRLGALLAALEAEPNPPTTVRTASEALTRHVADGLAALELESVRVARRIGDLGSGAGFPGLPLAVALPGASIDLIEASRRKCAVIERLAAACGAHNARVLSVRAEALAAREGRDAYELVTARAVASLAVLAEYAAPLLTRGGRLVAWKGRRDPEEEAAAELAAGRLGLGYEAVHRVRPFPEARDRHLHVLIKREATPAGFPRPPGRAAKRPLPGGRT